jgi:hypothetical protein
MRKYRVSLAALALSFTSAAAHADKLAEKQACVAAADHGQQHRDEGKHRLAREDFERCAQESCPRIVRKDCGQWLIDLEQQRSTVVIRARDEKGRGLTRVEVALDGEPLASQLDGQPIVVDPGEHVVRYEAPGSRAVEQRLTIKAGEKDRLLEVRLTSAAPPPPPPSAADGASRDGGPFDSIPLPTWILGGTALAAFAGATYFGVSGVNQRSDALGSGGCAPDCSSSEKSSIRTKFLLADISLGVGVVSAGLATYFFLRPREPQPGPAAAVGFAPHTSGGMATVRGQF